MPPVRNANFAWVQHLIYHLAPTGYAGFVLANGSMSSNESGEIRKNIVEADLVNCMVAPPGQIFYSTQIPTRLWFLARDNSWRPPEGQKKPLRDRRGEVLFIGAHKMGRMVDRTHRELTDEDIQRIATTYHAWRGEPDAGEHQDIPGFCKSVTLDEIRAHGYVLTPGRYVGAEAVQDDGEPFEEKMAEAVKKALEEIEIMAMIVKKIETLQKIKEFFEFVAGKNRVGYQGEHKRQDGSFVKVTITYDPETQRWYALYSGKVKVREGDTDRFALRPFAFLVRGTARKNYNAFLWFWGKYDIRIERQVIWIWPRE
ncbi:hypothetical protein HRbin36_00423 [bacterium HR36]|nr:hypothetical protein HRbin36_00423 [bacterium HR36]